MNKVDEDGFPIKKCICDCEPCKCLEMVPRLYKQLEAFHEDLPQGKKHIFVHTLAMYQHFLKAILLQELTKEQKVYMDQQILEYIKKFKTC